MASAWGVSWGSAWGGAWGSLSGDVAAVVTRGGGYPDGPARPVRREPEGARLRRRASEERRYQRLKRLDDAVEAAWVKLNPQDQLEVETVPVPEAIQPSVRISDLVVRPRIDLERAALDTQLYRQAIATLEQAIALYRERLADEEDDIEILLLAAS